MPYEAIAQVNGRNLWTGGLSTDSKPTDSRVEWLDELIDHNGDKWDYRGPVHGWKQTSVGGALNVSVDGPLSSVEPIIITCDGADDVFTDPTAPLQAEIVQISGFSAGKRRCLITWLCQAPAAATDIPFASAAVATINTGPDKSIAVSRLTVPNNGVGDHTIGTFNAQGISDKESAFWEISIDVNDVMIGFLPPVGTGALPVRLAVYVW